MTARPGGQKITPAVASPRLRLARLALERALSAEGVDSGYAGETGFWQTDYQGHLLAGVLATARPDARYDVELHLRAGWPTPPLHEVARAIREDVNQRAAGAGLATVLGSLEITFGDLAEPPHGGS